MAELGARVRARTVAIGQVVAVVASAIWPLPVAAAAWLAGLVGGQRGVALRAAFAWGIVLLPMIAAAWGDPFAWQVVALWVVGAGIGAWPGSPASTPGWWALLIVAVLFMGYERWAHTQTFAPLVPGAPELLRLWAPLSGVEQFAPQLAPGHPRYRSGTVSAKVDGTVRFGLELRAIDPDAAIGWYARDVALTRGTDAVDLFTPQADDGRAWRVWSDGEALGGRSFRVQGFWRGGTVEGGCGPVSLRVDARPWIGACVPAVATGEAWRPFEITWAVPDGVEEDRLRLHVGGDGTAWDAVALRDLRLEEVAAGTSRPLRGVLPSDLTLELELSTPMSETVSRARTGADPHQGWTRLELALPVVAGGEHRWLATVRVPASTSVEVRSVALTGDGVRLSAAPRPERSQAWFGHPNLAAHALVGLLLAGMFRLPSDRARVGLAALGLLAVALTGSRSGFLMAAAGVVYVLTSGSWGGAGRRRSVVIVTMVMAAVGGAWVLDARVVAWEEGNAVSRNVIWRAASELIAERPLQGWGSTEAAAALNDRLPEYDVLVAHAHNAWLDLGVRFGFPGMFAAGWACAGLAWLAWRRRGWQAIAALGLLLATNVVDSTLTVTYVWVAAAWLVSAPSLTETFQNDPSQRSKDTGEKRPVPLVG
jgi:hypothetical protein